MAVGAWVFVDEEVEHHRASVQRDPAAHQGRAGRAPSYPAALAAALADPASFAFVGASRAGMGRGYPSP